jgi:hypothetical protein
MRRVDYGIGPIKVPGLEAGVNITVGLPVIRRSYSLIRSGNHPVHLARNCRDAGS